MWGAYAAFLSPSLIAPPRGPVVVTTGAHGPRLALPRRPAGPAAPTPGRVPRTRQTSTSLSVRDRGPTCGAKQEIGWSEASAASSVPAFELSRVTTGNLSRVTDVAARQLLLAARRQGASGSRFPACSAGADRYGRPSWPSTRREALIRYVGSWTLGVDSMERERALALSDHDASTVRQRIGRVQDDRGAGLESTGDLSFVFVALTQLHGLSAHTALVNDEYRPAVALSE